MLATGIGWYTGQVEPDCMTALVVLGAYLLLFRSACLGPARAMPGRRRSPGWPWPAIRRIWA